MRSVHASRFALALLLAGMLYDGQAWAARCLFVSSYHHGYEWNDGIEQGIRTVLKGKCELKQFDMDTKRNTDESFAKRQALEAKQLIEAFKPDVVIASDDNASRYLIEPYYKNARLPVVFCGVNWTAKRYGYPYQNATGMIEVAPIKPLLGAVRDMLKTARTAVYLSTDVETEHTDFEHYREAYAAEGVQVSGVFVKQRMDWEREYIAAQRADFIILGNNAGIPDWDPGREAKFALEHADKLTVSNYDWMTPYAMLAMTKIPSEQGEWAASAALEILAGTPPTSIPITPNRRWDIYVNSSLLARAGLQLPTYLLNKAVKR
jgi:ABC-type uncharacterized transport system substrate-binding protein